MALINNEVDREDQLSTIKDGALRLADGLTDVAHLIGDPGSTDPEDAARAVKTLTEAVRDADEAGTLIALLEQVTEFDELG